jgi:choline kinase
MHAILLAAGRGSRLVEYNPQGHPKCLMEFAGGSLLARHLELLHRLGIHQADLVVGFEADRITLRELQQEPDFHRRTVPDLVSGLVEKGHAPQVRYTAGHWMDINKLEDLQRAGDFAHGQSS